MTHPTPDNSEILLASDFSIRADRPLARARRLADASGRALTILHVATDDDHRRAADQGLALKDGLRAELPPDLASIELLVETGSAPETIAEVAARRGSGLIVVGVARRNSLGDYFLGTAVDHVVRNAVTPVLVVHRPVHADYGALAVATDFSDCSADAVIAAGRLFPASSISVIHAAHIPFKGWLDSEDTRSQVMAEASARMEAFLSSPKLADMRERLVPTIEFGAFIEVVHRTVDALGADLLVLGTHGHSGLFHATIGSNAEAMLAASPVDVLMVRA